MVNQRIPFVAGLSLAGCFAIYASWFLYGVAQGKGEAAIFIFVLTLPFSIVGRFFCDWLQSVLQLSSDMRMWCEVVLATLIGLLEFFTLGYVLGRIGTARSREG